MRHLTLSTGHQSESSEADVDPAILDKITFLLRRHSRGGTAEYALPWVPDYTVQQTVERRVLLVTIFGAEPLVTFGVASDRESAATLWPLLRHHEQLSGMDRAQDLPPSPPWCVAVLLPGLLMDPRATAWLAEAEQCFALAWLRLIAPKAAS